MRIAVRNSDGDVHAYKLGRIDTFVNHLTGETHSAEEVAASLVGQAKKEFADCEVYIEKLMDNEDGTSVWEPVTTPDGSPAEAQDAGEVASGARATHPPSDPPASFNAPSAPSEVTPSA